MSARVRPPTRVAILAATAALALLCVRTPAFAYGVLSHEALIDSSWKEGIEPVLQQRFPEASAEQLLACRAYAYGGCVIQDMGYYPFGSKLFTDLLHYVRSGDFAVAMVEEAKTPEELAFALGALAHFFADRDGHVAINRVVPMTYAKLRRKYGENVSYEQKPSAHLRVELSFDVLHVANGRFLPKDYHDLVGFEVSKPLLERAFQRTYGIELKDVVPSLDLAVGSYRRTASRILPEITRAAWQAKKKEILQAEPKMTRNQFVFALARADYEKEWGRDYKEPGPFAKLLSLLIRIAPKVGPLKALKFQVPTPEAEKLFAQSFEAAGQDYREALLAVRAGRKLELDDPNLDTGKPTKPGAYELADKTYAELLVKLAARDFAGADPEMLVELREYCSNAAASSGKHGRSRRKVESALVKLQQAQAVALSGAPR